MRFQHVLWTPLWLSHVASTAALLGSAGLLVAGLATQTWRWVIAGGSLLAFYSVGLALVLVVLDRCIRRIVRRRGENVPPFVWSWKLPFAGVLVQVVHLGCLLSALCLRHIVWRGISYAVDGPHQLRLLEYRPYAPAGSSRESIV